MRPDYLASWWMSATQLGWPFFICTITTGHVDDGFGQATIEDGPDVLNISVRCDRTGVLTRGSKALVVDFDSTRQAYVVEPASELVDIPSS